MAHVPHAAARRSARLLAAAVASLFAATATAQQQVYEITGSGLKQTKAPEPGSDEATIAQARRLTADGNPSQAIDLLDAWIETNETARNQWLPDAFLARGDAHLADDDEYKALVDYERITRDYAGSDLFVKALERELDIAKMYLGGLRKKSLGLFRIDSGIPIAEEIIMRINERLPGSRLAERAMLMLADYYYDERDLRMAAESYDVFLTLFPRSEHRQKAMQRRVYANIAQFKGPRYDASGLVDAKFLVQRYQTQYPLDAERIGLDDTLTARLDEQTARQLLEVAAWYERRGDPPSQRLTLQRLVLRHPQTGAAKIAADILTKNNWPLQPKPRPPPPPPPPQPPPPPPPLDPRPGGRPVSPRRFAALALAACLPACLVAGCASDSRQGYAFGTGFPADIKSVSVPIFRNASTTPGIEADVTEAIIKELQRAGGMTITTAQGADTTLTGVITDVRMKRLSVRSGTGLVQELAYQITVDFDWKDERSGKLLTSRRDFVATDTFVPATGVGERIDTGRLAATGRLARDLVNELRGAW